MSAGEGREILRTAGVGKESEHAEEKEDPREHHDEATVAGPRAQERPREADDAFGSKDNLDFQRPQRSTTLRVISWELGGFSPRPSE